MHDPPDHLIDGEEPRHGSLCSTIASEGTGRCDTRDEDLVAELETDREQPAHLDPFSEVAGNARGRIRRFEHDPRAPSAVEYVERRAAGARPTDGSHRRDLGVGIDLWIVGQVAKRDRPLLPRRRRQRALLAAAGGERDTGKKGRDDDLRSPDVVMVGRRRMRHTQPMKTARRVALEEGAAVVGFLVALMWVVEIVNKIDGQRLSRDGIYPRSLSGLPGILSAPFLHVGFGHLEGNTIPFIVLGLVIAVGGALRVIEVTAIVILIAGLGTWLTAGSGTDTVGASGVVFGYAGYLIARGFFTRNVGALAVGVVVALLFGGALAADLVPQGGISWQDHLFGGLGGILAARVGSGSHRSKKAAVPRTAAGPD